MRAAIPLPRRFACAAAFFLVLSAADAAPAASLEPAPTLEYAVKATFLAKFAPFVTWPPSSFTSETSAVSLCVVGDDAVTRLSDAAARGQRDGMRAIAVRHLTTADAGAGCHIMYIAGSEEQSVAAALEAVKGKPVLTITDSAHDGAAGAIIRFTVENNRVRFDIDDRAAAASGLAISSKLLSLARLVRPRA